MSEEGSRGSHFLAAKYTEQDFDRHLAVGEAAGAKLTDVFPLGLAAFDGVSLSWQVTPEQVVPLIQGLTAMGILQKMQLVTKGTPVEVDIVEVSVQAGSARMLKP